MKLPVLKTEGHVFSNPLCNFSSNKEVSDV
jgi:hypothetical protein